jgi:hypothetical protein
MRFTRLLGIPMVVVVVVVVLALGGGAGTALAQIEPAAPGSVEYTLISNGQSWIQTSDPITVGIYVEDILIDRSGQPDGRGNIGIVTATGFDQDYGVMAATVDFGRDYSAGIIFPELTAVQIVPEPSTAMAMLLCVPGAVLRRRRPRGLN